MNDKDDKFSSDFEDDFDKNKNAESEEFVDHFDDDDMHFGEKTKKETDEFDEFEDHQHHDEFDEFAEESQTNEETEEQEPETTEEEGSKPGQSIFEYLKSNIIILLVGGFFIITGVVKLYSMFAKAPATPQIQGGPTQNLQFTQKNQKPAAPAAKENAPKVATTEVAPNKPQAPTPVPTVPLPNQAQVPPTTAQAPQQQPSPPTAATTPQESIPAVPAIPAAPAQQAIEPVLPAASTSTSPQLVESKVEQSEGAQNKPSKISAFFASEKPVSEKEFKQINEKIVTLEKQLQELKALEEKLTKAQTSGGSSSELTDLKSQLIQTNKIVTELSNQVRAQQLNSNMGNEAVGGGWAGEVPRGILANPRPVRDVIVEAVIPGRAWLKDLKGRLITVQVGDDLPGYGTVVLIDAHRGIVRTDEHFEFRSL